MTLEEKEYRRAGVNGKIEFIRHCSASSYKKLEKIVGVKYGETVKLDNI